MKTLTGVIALVLALMLGTSNGVIAADQKSRPTGVEKKQPATGEKTVDKASPELVTGELTGKVTGVDPTAKTFTAMTQGRAITFSAARLSTLPTVGELIDISFTWEPGRTPNATSTTEPGSEAQRKKTEHCSAPHKLCGPLESLNLKECPC